MAISDWPQTERPREKLLNLGPHALSDAELVAIFLGSGMAGKTALDLARDLLNRFNGLRGVLEADATTFCGVPGVGPVRYVLLQAGLEMSRRHLLHSLSPAEVMDSPQATRNFFSSHLRHREHEVFSALFLDNQHAVICCEDLFTGTIDGASVYPREVVKRALALNAAAIIFAHNHPSGVAEPSQADIRITRRLQDALQLVDIRVLDHLVVGDGQPVSLAERGLL
ncbi:MAG: DNA repair protein RadC [Pseudomonadales bacterium]